MREHEKMRFPKRFTYLDVEVLSQVFLPPDRDRLLEELELHQRVLREPPGVNHLHLGSDVAKVVFGQGIIVALICGYNVCDGSPNERLMMDFLTMAANNPRFEVGFPPPYDGSPSFKKKTSCNINASIGLSFLP